MLKNSSELPYYSLNTFLRETYGEKIVRVSVNLDNPCPNHSGNNSGCIFCLPESYGQPNDVTIPTISQQLDLRIESIKKFYKKTKKFIAYFQSGSNTFGPPEELEKAFKEALAHKEIVAISISTRPDCFSEEILKVIEKLCEKNDVWIELGVQSMHDKTLEFINRGHTNSASVTAIKKLKKIGIKHVVAHVILGLPEESEQQMHETFSFFQEIGVDGFKIHHLQVIKNTVLEKMWQDGEIKLFDFENYKRLVVDILEKVSPEIVIHRLFGSSGEKYLIAPKWDLHKSVIQQQILDEFKERRTFQGKLL